MSSPQHVMPSDPDYPTIIELAMVALDDETILDQLDISDEEAQRLYQRLSRIQGNES